MRLGVMRVRGQGHALALAAVLLLAGCATTPPTTPSNNLPAPHRYTDFTGRLIVIDSNARWQAMLNWHAETPETGWMRITHAASSRVVELRWQGARIWLRDNQAPSPAWRQLRPNELASHGIPMQPSGLAALLLGQTPSGFTAAGNGIWHARHGRARITVRWRDNRLSITDTTHGRKATLIILRQTPPARGADHG